MHNKQLWIIRRPLAVRGSAPRSYVLETFSWWEAFCLLARESRGVRFAWHVPESCCCSNVSQLRLQGISANGFACSRGQKIVVLWIPKVTWSTFSACVLLGMCPNPAAVRVFRNMRLQGISANGSACSRGQEIVVLWIPKVTWSTFSACVLLGMCPNPAAVRVFRNCASKGFLLMVVLAREDKRLLFLPESCCCSSVSQHAPPRDFCYPLAGKFVNLLRQEFT